MSVSTVKPTGNSCFTAQLFVQSPKRLARSMNDPKGSVRFLFDSDSLFFCSVFVRNEIAIKSEARRDLPKKQGKTGKREIKTGKCQIQKTCGKLWPKIHKNRGHEALD